MNRQTGGLRHHDLESTLLVRGLRVEPQRAVGREFAHGSAGVRQHACDVEDQQRTQGEGGAGSDPTRA